MFAAINSLLCSVIKSGWNQAGVPLTLDNTERPTAQSFIRFTVLPIREVAQSLGGATKRRHFSAGVCTAQIFTPQGEASYSAYQYADKIAKLFRNKSWIKTPNDPEQLPVHLYIDTINAVPVGNRDGVFQVNLDISFRAWQENPVAA